MQRDGFSMMFWEFVDVDASRQPDYVGEAALAADLHAALCDYPAVLRVMGVAGMLQAVACHALVPRLPMLAEGLAPSLQAWRTMPFAGGLG